MDLKDYKQALSDLLRATKRVTALHEQAEDEVLKKAHHNITRLLVKNADGEMFLLGQIRPCFSQFGHSLLLYFLHAHADTLKKNAEQRKAFASYKAEKIDLSTLLCQTDEVVKSTQRGEPFDPTSEEVINRFGFCVRIKVDDETFQEMVTAKSIDLKADEGEIKTKFSLRETMSYKTSFCHFQSV
ncbi:MAG: hypothetical protein Q3994_07500 [Prevotella sp.]|nr:hypothetical protein [Prevotella sp.]